MADKKIRGVPTRRNIHRHTFGVLEDDGVFFRNRRLFQGRYSVCNASSVAFDTNEDFDGGIQPEALDFSANKQNKQGVRRGMVRLNEEIGEY